MSRFGGRFGKAIFSLAMCALLSPAGCGFKDKPVPPQHVVPAAVLDLQAELDDRGATLTWSYPQKTVTGDTVEEIDAFELYRAEIPVSQYCKTCPIPYSAAIEVPGGSMAPNSNKTATCEIRDLRPGNLYFFKVRSQSGWWRESQDSNEVSFFWQTPPMAPEGLTGVGGDGKNTLQWKPVGQLRDATPTTAPVQYQMYRSVDGGSFAKVGEPIATASYVDAAVENGRAYAYQVQAINVYSQGAVRSALSAPAKANPLDRTPPPVPAGVAAIRTEMGVKIYWEHVEAADLAGYRVYRRVGASAPVLAGEVLLPYNMFIDAKAPSGSLVYSVASIDAQSPANESARSAEIPVEQ